MKYLAAEAVRGITFLVLFCGGFIYQLYKPESTILGIFIIFIASLLHWGLSVLYAKLLNGDIQ